LSQRSLQISYQFTANSGTLNAATASSREPLNYYFRARVRDTLRLAVYLQSVRLGDKPLGTHDQNFHFQRNTCGHSPHVTSFLTGRWVCRYNCCWSSPAQSFSGQSPAGQVPGTAALGSLLYRLREETTENTISIVLAQQYFDYCLRIHYCGNVFNKPLPINERLVWLYYSGFQALCHINKFGSMLDERVVT
jgi:hypothetical protein